MWIKISLALGTFSKNNKPSGNAHFTPGKIQHHTTMKHTIQILIAPIVAGISVKGPYHPLANESYKKAGGKYDKIGRRWILPDTVQSWDLIDELFGHSSMLVLAEVNGKLLATTGNQLVIDGYVVATWSTYKSCIILAEGVYLVEGSWDDAASAAAQAPCLTAGDAKYHLVVRSDFAMRHGLQIVEELGEQILTNRLSVFSDAELIAELRNRGYRVERDHF